MFETHVDKSPHPRPRLSHQLLQSFPWPRAGVWKGWVGLAWPFRLILSPYSLPAAPPPSTPALQTSCPGSRLAPSFRPCLSLNSPPSSAFRRHRTCHLALLHCVMVSPAEHCVFVGISPLRFLAAVRLLPWGSSVQCGSPRIWDRACQRAAATNTREAPLLRGAAAAPRAPG